MAEQEGLGHTRPFTRKKHVEYFKRNLAVLPQQFETYDSSLTSLVFFSICGLHILDAFDEVYSEKDRQEMVAWVYQHLVPSKQGFRGSMSHGVPNNDKQNTTNSPYDPPNLASTFFCLCSLAMLEDPLSRLQKETIIEYVIQCQQPSGIFLPYHGARIHESDLRYIYLGVAILRMLGANKTHGTKMQQVVDRASEYIYSAVSFDGGFCDSALGESHGGLTYCAIASLHNMDISLDDTQSSTHATRQLTPEQRRNLIRWLAFRQQADGGFNGRVNKPSDSCYSFWVGATLALLSARGTSILTDKNQSALSLIDAQSASEFLLDQQHAIIGGCVKTQGAPPDPLHSCLSLAALSLFQQNMTDIDASLCLPKRAVQYMESHWRGL